MFVKVKFADFTRTTRECVGHDPTAAAFHQLLREAWTRRDGGVRLLGVGVRFAGEPHAGQAELDLGA